MKLTIEGGSPLEIAMLLKGLGSKTNNTTVVEAAAEPLRFQWHWPTSSVAQVGDQTFIWYEETGMPGGVEYSLEAAQHAIDARVAWLNQPNKAGPVHPYAGKDGRTWVAIEVLQENDFLNLSRVGEQLYVLHKDGRPVWVGDTEQEGRAKAQAEIDALLDQPKPELKVGLEQVDYELLYEKGSHELARYGDTLYVCYADGVPVWCGHSETEGRKSVDARERGKTDIDAITKDAQAYSLTAPELPEMSVGLVDLPAEVEVELEPSKLQTKVAGPGFQEPVYGEDTQVTEPKPARPTDEEGHYWVEGTRCQLKGCSEYLRPAGRKRESGYCAKHRNS